MTARAVLVWDLPTRIFHWALVIAVGVSYLTGGEESSWLVVHTVSGYVVALLLLFRLVWGFWGSAHSRFSDFIYSLGSVRAYARRLVRLEPQKFVGHNPLGGWMVILLLVVLAANVITGLLSGQEQGPGGLLLPLIAAPGEEGLGEIHEVLANVIVVLACLHILGVAADWLLTRENLLRAMITGEKILDEESAAREQRPVSGWRALVVTGLVAVAGFALFQKTDFAQLATVPAKADDSEESQD
jgi:cytochrome b